MRIFLLICFLQISVIVFGDTTYGNVYWIQLNTKTGTPFKIENPEEFLSERSLERRKRQSIEIDSTDLPVNPVFIDSLLSIGFNVLHASRWMNGVIATLDSSLTLDSVNKPSFISQIELRKGIHLKSASYKLEDVDSLNENYYAHSVDQIRMLNGHILHEYSKGEGIQIAVIDAGFNNADTITALKNIFFGGQILGNFDFVKRGNNVFNESDHGTMVLSTMAMNLPGLMVGTAPEASYWLLRSEDGLSESPIEEDYWVIAVEFADSVGCDVINTSLGYTVFDNSIYDHNYSEYTGDSIRISRAANMAVEKGIVVVCSAGNDGSGSWKYISFPSEAKEVLCVASVDNQGEISSFSSKGFESDSNILKPDIAALGSGASIVSSTGKFGKASGTSFSSPIISGLAACLVGLYPEKKASEIIEMIIKSGSRYPKHSNEYGFGIPDFGSLVRDEIDTIKVSSQFYGYIIARIYPNPVKDKFELKYADDFKSIDIYSLDGHRIFQSEITNRTSSYELSEFYHGLYFVFLKGDKGTQTIKLIKQ